MDKVYFSKLSNAEDFPDDMKVLESKVAADLLKKLAIAIEALEEITSYAGKTPTISWEHVYDRILTNSLQALEKITAIRKN